MRFVETVFPEVPPVHVVELTDKEVIILKNIVAGVMISKSDLARRLNAILISDVRIDEKELVHLDRVFGEITSGGDVVDRLRAK